MVQEKPGHFLSWNSEHARNKIQVKTKNTFPPCSGRPGFSEIIP